MKTINVLNGDGKPFSRTYPRRADNMVRKGWARWVDENRIQIIPTDPSKEAEGTNMSENLYSKAFDHISNSDIDITAKNEQIMRLLEMEFAKDNQTEQINNILDKLNKLTPFLGTVDMPALGAIVSAIEELEVDDADMKLETLKEIAFKILDTKNEAFSKLETLVKFIIESVKSA